MGEVYKARDTRLNRTVAIKVSNEQFSERFEREAHAVASLNHSNVCTLHDVGPNYLVMEFIEGVPLFRLTKGNDCCSAMSVPAEATLGRPLSDQNGQRQTLITITAEEICLCDPPSQLTKKSRSLKCLYLWKCS